MAFLLGASASLAFANDTAEGTEQAAPAAVAGDEIVVSGRRVESEKELRRTARKFVAELGEPGPMGQVSRWGVSVCPRVDGLTPALNRYIARRIRDRARAIGDPAAQPCGDTVNAWVVFTTAPDKFSASVARRQPGLLGYHHFGERKRLAAFEPPMKSWYVTSTAVVGGETMVDQAYSNGLPQGTGSRIKPLYQSRFQFALVVVDSNRVEGEEIGPVADRISMMVLSNAAPRAGCSSLPSILDFLQPACPGAQRAGLTAYDQAYLQGLYTFDRNELRGFMRDTIARDIARVDQAAVTEPLP